MAGEKRSVTFDIEALKIYDGLQGHGKKSEAASEGLKMWHRSQQSGGYVTLEQHNRDIAELKRQIEKMKGSVLK